MADIDLFKKIHCIPQQVKNVLEEYSYYDTLSFDEIDELLKKLVPYGLTFDYDMGGTIFNLRLMKLYDIAEHVYKQAQIHLPNRYKSYKAVYNVDYIEVLAYDKNNVHKATFLLFYQGSYMELISILKVSNRNRKFSYFHNGQPNKNCTLFKSF